MHMMLYSRGQECPVMPIIPVHLAYPSVAIEMATEATKMPL